MGRDWKMTETGKQFYVRDEEESGGGKGQRGEHIGRGRESQTPGEDSERGSSRSLLWKSDQRIFKNI